MGFRCVINPFITSGNIFKIIPIRILKEEPDSVDLETDLWSQTQCQIQILIHTYPCACT